MTKLTKRFTLLFFGLMASSAFFFSCTNVDKTLGLDLIPDDEKRVFDTAIIIPDAYTVTMGAIYTHSPSCLMVGSYYDPMFGETKAGCVFQVLPRYDSASFGEGATYKSLTLKMALIGGPIGDATSDQILNVYELKERIYYDSVYYASIRIDTMIESTPIASFIYQGQDTLEIELEPEFATKLFNVPKDGMALNRDTLTKSKFFDYIKGIYITVDNSNGTSRMNFLNPYASLTLRYRNNEVSDTTCEYSTFKSYDYYNNNTYLTQFNVVKHNHSLADPSQKIPHLVSHLGDTATTPLDSVLYVQGFFGATPYVKITNQKMSDWLQSVNLDPSRAAIIRAELVMELENFPDFDISKYPGSLGAMTMLNPLLTYNYNYGTYLYAGGCLASFYYSKSLFDGDLNKSQLKYSFNITHEMQAAIRNKKDLEFYLTPYTSNEGNPQYNQLIYYIGPNQYTAYKAVMKGPKHPERPLKLVLTYAIPE